ncbi:MAG: transposase, partial [Actinomycetia bacterium]|nr:transposase [Actinomycetes bacterium]
SADLLHGVVREGLPDFLDQLDAAGRGLPHFVVRELERYEACGDHADGFAWLSCGACDHHRLVPFSCKGRGFCPSCGGRRMADRAAHWVERVLPAVGIRQWVLTVPWSRRFLLARHPHLVRGVLGIAVREVFGWLRDEQAGRGLGGGQTGSVTVVQRFGSALRLNVHFHILVLDGCYVAGSDGVPVFHRARPPATALVEALVERIAVKSERFLARAGHGPDDEPASDPDDGQELVQAASLAGRVGLGRRAGRRTRRVVLVGGREVRLPARCGVFGGYNLHAGVWVGPRDRVGLERLARYVCRPALAKSRLERRADGHVVLRLKRAWSDGTAAFVFSPAELVSRLASLVPPPRANQVLYHGVLAPNASWRSLVVPKPEPDEGSPALVSAAAVAAPLGRRRTWSTLLLRVFGVDGWCCPHCGERMTLRVPVVGPSSSGRVLRGLARSARGPPSQAQTTA